LFLLLGYTSNQINALWKLVIVATNEGTKDPVEEKVSAAQAQIFVRLLIGIMREALKLVEKRFLGSTLGKEYIPLLNPQAKEAFDRLKKRFSAPDKFVVIRDNFAFHHPTLDDMEAAFQLAVKSDGNDTDWCMYLNDGLLNSFFFASDFVLVHGMANAMDEPDVNEAHRKLLADIAPVANDLSTFAFGFAEAIFIKRFGELSGAVVAEIKDAFNRGFAPSLVCRDNEFFTDRRDRIASASIMKTDGDALYDQVSNRESADQLRSLLGELRQGRLR
jgi:hypothetical protein